jgi:hypothetical protein
MIPAIALISSLVQFAPQLVGLFKGGEKSQEVAEVAASLARTVTGTSTNEAALEVLKADPSKLLEYQGKLVDQQTTFEQLLYADRKDARARDVEYVRAGKHNYRADFLIGVSVLIVFVIIGIVVWSADINEFAKGCLTTILGVFLNQLTNAYQFEFGNTRKGEESQAKITNEYLKS